MVRTMFDTVGRPEGVFKAVFSVHLYFVYTGAHGLFFYANKPLFLPKLFIAAILTVSKAVISSRRWWTFYVLYKILWYGFFFFSRKGILNKFGTTDLLIFYTLTREIFFYYYIFRILFCMQYPQCFTSLYWMLYILWYVVVTSGVSLYLYDVLVPAV